VWFRRQRDDRWDLSVDTASLTHEQRVIACRAALGQVRPDADRLQTDVPWGQSESWPDDVRAAATVFRDPARGYGSSGWVTPVSDRQWDAYLLLAPYAYNSDVWTSGMTPLADVNDEGSVIAVRLPEDRIEAFHQALAPAQVITHPPRDSRPERSGLTTSRTS